MKLIRYNYPETVFGNGIRRWLSDAFDGGEGFGGWVDRTLAPGRSLPADLYSSDDAYHARFELPGVPKDAVRVSLENSVLTVSTEHKEESDGRSESFSLSRAIAVPDDADANAISAKLENGVLGVTIPKAEDRKPRTIAIE